jgi:hypothetical protein
VPLWNAILRYEPQGDIRGFLLPRVGTPGRGRPLIWRQEVRPYRLLLGLRFVAALFGAYVGKLRTEQNKLRGIVNPYQNYNERRRRTVGGFEPLLTDIKADQKLPDLEQRVGVVVQLKDAFNTVWEVAPEKQGGIWGFMRT